MPRVHTQRANKDYPEQGIKKGQTYYWWQFHHSGKIKSATYPKASQLTQSEFWGEVYSLQEEYEPTSDFDDIENQIEELKSRLEELRDAQQEKLDNMPEGLQQGATGELLQERYDAIDSVVSELDGVDVTIDVPDDKPDDYDEDAAKADRAEEIWGEVRDYLSNISCS
jgi:hypothetical protein